MLKRDEEKSDNFKNKKDMTKSKTVNFKTTEDSQTMMKQNDGICFGVVGTFVASFEQVPNLEHVCDGRGWSDGGINNL